MSNPTELKLSKLLSSMIEDWGLDAGHYSLKKFMDLYHSNPELKKCLTILFPNGESMDEDMDVNQLHYLTDRLCFILGCRAFIDDEDLKYEKEMREKEIN